MVSGGDMATTASTRPPRSEASPASALNPRNPAARRTRFRLSDPGNGFTRVIDPQSVTSRRKRARRPTFFDCVVAIPGQRGHDVHFVSERRELGHDPSHHHTRRRGVGREVRAEDRDPEPILVHDRSNASA